MTTVTITTNPWKMKVYSPDGKTQLSGLKPRKVRLLVDAGLASTALNEKGVKILLVNAAGLSFISSGRPFEQLKPVRAAPLPSPSQSALASASP